MEPWTFRSGATEGLVRRMFRMAIAVPLLVSGLVAAAADWKSPPGADFPLVGGNYANLRYSTLTTIDRSRVARLGGAWMQHVENGRGGSMQATPVVVGGTMY